jgi:hypothetical protein
MNTMSFPKIEQPVHTLILPEKGTELTFRSFTVKEDKILLTATEDDNDTYNTMIKNTIHILKNCIIKPSNLDVDNLPLIDIEYIFLNLAMKSKGEEYPLKMTCKNIIDENGTECNKENSVNLDLHKVYIERNADYKKQFNLTDELGVTFKYPSLEVLEKINPDQDDFNSQIDFLIHCVDNCFDNETVYDASKATYNEIKEFIESLSTTQLEKINNNFFSKLPQIAYDLKFTCESCGNQEEINLRGLSNFF